MKIAPGLESGTFELRRQLHGLDSKAPSERKTPTGPALSAQTTVPRRRTAADDLWPKGGERNSRR